MDFEKFRKIDWIDDRLAISGYISDYDTLISENIDIVVNVRSECHDDINELSKRGISYYWIPTVDYLAPRTDQFDTFKRIIYKNYDSRILVHCESGRGRSATFIVSYLIDDYNLSLKKAIDVLKEQRDIVSLTEFQMKKLNLLYGD